MTTEREAAAALDGETYLQRVGITEYSATGQRIIQMITNDPIDEAAENVRNYLWGYLGAAGGTSAAITTSIFKALGRGRECDPDWI